MLSTKRFALSTAFNLNLYNPDSPDTLRYSLEMTNGEITIEGFSVYGVHFTMKGYGQLGKNMGELRWDIKVGRRCTLVDPLTQSGRPPARVLKARLGSTA